jgi:hypothetical protein
MPFLPAGTLLADENMMGTDNGQVRLHESLMFYSRQHASALRVNCEMVAHQHELYNPPDTSLSICGGNRRDWKSVRDRLVGAAPVSSPL